MFTLYRIVKRCVAESVPDRASVHTRTAAFKAVSAPEQYCSAPLLKVERSVSDRFLRRSESSLNTFIGAEIATEPRFGKLSFQIKRERCKLHNCSGPNRNSEPSRNQKDLKRRLDHFGTFWFIWEPLLEFSFSKWQREVFHLWSELI